jgi:hypothetical protein
LVVYAQSTTAPRAGVTAQAAIPESALKAEDRAQVEELKRQVAAIAAQRRTEQANLANLGVGEQRSKMRSSAFCSIATQTPNWGTNSNNGSLNARKRSDWLDLTGPKICGLVEYRSQ